MAEQGIQIDISKYIEQKEAGSVKLVKLNGVPHYAKPGFDPESGAPRPVLVPLDRTAIAASIEAKQKEVVIFTQLLADIDKAEEKLA